MPTIVSFNGTNYSIPLAGEVGWGDQVHAFLVALANATLVSGSSPSALTVTTLTIKKEVSELTSVIVNNGDTLSPSRSNVAVSALSDVLLNTTTAISNGTTPGQILMVSCTGNFSVTIQHGANTTMNGDVILNPGDSIEFKWDATLKWVEQRRSN